MTLFSSRRERRLWLWVLAVMVAIYATLGLAQTLAETLRERGLLDVSIGLFLLCMFLVAVTILTQALKVRPGGAEVAVAIGVATAYLLVFTRMTVPTERSHLIEYGVVGILIYEALTERRATAAACRYRPCSPSWRRQYWACSTNASRRFCQTASSIQDILFNLLAGTMAVGASVALTWARRWTTLQRLGLK